MNNKAILIGLFLLTFFSQISLAQKEETTKRKMTIVTKTIDENGKETVTTITKEGEEISDEEIDKIIQQHLGEDHKIDVEVNTNGDQSEQIIIKEKNNQGEIKQYKIIKNSQTIELEGEGDDDVIWVEGDDEKEKKKEVIIINKKGDNSEDILINKNDENKADNNKVIFITEDGETHELKGENVKIIKKEKGDKNSGDSEIIWTENEETTNGDVIILEEETTEEMDENGKVIKKTIKKKKIVKKGN
ncbi:MAG: hypothetical protein R2788_22915 [Saprospiraceae bacterium]